MSIFYPSRRDRGCAKDNRGCLTCCIKFLQKKNSKEVGIGIIPKVVCRKKSVRKSGGRGEILGNLEEFREFLPRAIRNTQWHL